MFASTSIFTMKIVLMATGVVSLAVAAKYTLIPLIIHFTVSELPTVWSVFLLLFKPPYLYLILNGIIIIIAAISRFTQSQTELSPPLLIPAPNETSSHDIDIYVPPRQEVWDVKMPVVVNGLEVVENFKVEKEEETVEEEMPRGREVILPATEKPLVLTALAAQKQSKLNLEGRSKLRVKTMHRTHETLDNTWRMITEGRHAPPLTERVKNSDTFENFEKTKINSSVRENSFFRKSATFKDRTNFLHEPPVSSVIVRKEPSLSKDELNTRVEAFIKKFNDEMRLQREESLQRYMEMVKAD